MCRLRRNRRIAVSVAAASMSRVFLYSVAFLLSTACRASSDVPNNWDNCAEFDIGELEDHLSKLSLENVPTVNMMVGQFKCPVAALPFGALKSDWARLLLLRNAQPKDSDFLHKLGRLFRILVVAYFRMEEDFEVAEPAVGNLCRNTGVGYFSSREKSSHGNGTRSVNREKETGKLDNSISDSGETNETASSFTWSAVLGNEESIGTINTEPTTFTSVDVVTGADKNGNSDTILNDISTTTDVASSPVGKQIDRNAIIAASDAAIRTQKYSAVSVNYSDNNAFNTETSGIDIRTVMKEEITPRAGIILANNRAAESQSTAASFTGIETSKLTGNKIDPITDRSASAQPMGTDSRLFNNTSIVSSFDVFETLRSTSEKSKSTVGSVREKATTGSRELTENTIDSIAEVTTEFSGSTKQMEIDWVLFNTLSTTSSSVIEQKSTIKTARKEATIKSTSVNEEHYPITTNSESTENENDLITEMTTEFSAATMPIRTSPRVFNNSSPTSFFASSEKSTVEMVEEEATAKSISASEDHDSKKTSFTKVESPELAKNTGDLATEFSTATNPPESDSRLINNSSTISPSVILEKSIAKSEQEKATSVSTFATEKRDSKETGSTTTESTELLENKGNSITEQTTEFGVPTKPMETNSSAFNSPSATLPSSVFEKSTVKSAHQKATTERLKSTTKSAQGKAMTKSIAESEEYDSIQTSFAATETSESPENKVNLITETSVEFGTAKPTRTNSLFSPSAILEKATIKSVQEETSTSKDRDSKETKGRGDFSVSNSLNSGENRVDEEEELKFATTQYGDSLHFNCGKSANDSKGNGGAGKSCVYSDKISDIGAATSTKSFNQSPWNRGTSDFERTPWNFSNSILPRNKIRRPAIQKKPPVDNEFWKYIVASRKLASATSTGRSTLETEDSDGSTGRSAKSKKRQSLNTNREKNFRWFYNFEQDREKYPSNTWANEGTRIECNEKKSKIADEE